MKNLIELPNGLFALSVIKEFNLSDNAIWFDETIEDNFSILGTATEELISFDVEPYVGFTEDDYGIMFYDYKEGVFKMDFSKEDSFRSQLIRRNIYFVNPMGETQPYVSVFDTHIDSPSNKNRTEWERFESNKIENLLILKKE